MNQMDWENFNRQTSQVMDRLASALHETATAFSRWWADFWDSLPPDVRQALIDAGEREARKERHRRRYQRMMERGRQRR